MNPQSLIDDCNRSGVDVHMDGNALKLRGKAAAVKVAAERLRPYKTELIKYLTAPKPSEASLLARFRFDLCDADPDPALIARVNNICYHLVTVKGWEFGEAMTAASTWAAHNPPQRDEAAFIGVRRLWNAKPVQEY